MIEREIKVGIDATPEELAAEFCGMDGNDQAKFFSAIADLVKEWDKPFCFQLSSVVTSDDLTSAGRVIMQEIGEYGEVIEQ